MGAKLYPVLFCAALLAAPGCANLARFAPPGFVKYEDLAGDAPPNPAIEARIAEVKKEQKGDGFPNLSKAPSKTPDAMPAAEREAAMEELRSARERVDADVAAARIAAAADRAASDAQSAKGSLEGARDALGEAVRRDDEAARKERGLKPRAPSE